MKETSTENYSLSIRGTVAGAAFTALTAAGAYISIPIGPVPVVLQNFFVLLAGLLLGPKRAFAAISVYLMLGAAGLPVFAGGTGGVGHFFGPTGGYLVGFLFAATITGLLSPVRREEDKAMLGRSLIALCAGTAAIYLVGIPWLKVSTDISWTQSVTAGLLPFIPGDIVKIIAASFAARSILPRFRAFLHGNG
ncbi:MAG: biotin transporter BioY [Sediminispirochaetaceae bacterium]